MRDALPLRTVPSPLDHSLAGHVCARRDGSPLWALEAAGLLLILVPGPFLDFVLWCAHRSIRDRLFSMDIGLAMVRVAGVGLLVFGAVYAFRAFRARWPKGRRWVAGLGAGALSIFLLAIPVGAIMRVRRGPDPGALLQALALVPMLIAVALCNFGYSAVEWGNQVLAASAVSLFATGYALQEGAAVK